MKAKSKTKKKPGMPVVGQRLLDRQHAGSNTSKPLCPVCGGPVDTSVEYARTRSLETKFKPVTWHPACLMVHKAQKAPKAEFTA